MANNALFVTIISPDGVIFQGEADSVSSIDIKGPFDILPMHQNFISIIKNLIIVNKKTGGKEEIGIDNGILRAYENKINIFLGIETTKT